MKKTTEGYSGDKEWTPLSSPYSTDDLLVDIKKQHSYQASLIEKKNSDYADHFNPFENFMRTAEATGISTEQAFLFHIVNKISRLKTLVQKSAGPSVESESISDSLNDLANYANLWHAYRTWYEAQHKNDF